MRKLLVLVIGVSLLAGGAWVGYQLSNGHIPLIGDTCRAFVGDQVVRLRPLQMQSAATIAAVGQRKGVPERAVQIAVATAMQESELFNLPGGDRDSIGLFQQRASQGWGTPAQLADPRYSTAAFYDHLLKVPGWQTMRLTDAAQAVQRSAHPQLYERWSADADALASAFLGKEGNAVTCELRAVGAAAASPTPSGAKSAVAQLQSDLNADWGTGTGTTITPEPDGRSLVLTVPGAGTAGDAAQAAATAAGWRYAHWLVAWSRTCDVRRVTYAGRSWTADSGKWDRAAAGPAGQLVVEVGA
jgi:hypothetical protein